MTRFEAELDKKLTMLENQIEWHIERIKQIEAEMRRAYRLPQVKAELERDLADLQKQYRELWQMWKEQKDKDSRPNIPFFEEVLEEMKTA